MPWFNYGFKKHYQIHNDFNLVTQTDGSGSLILLIRRMDFHVRFLILFTNGTI